MPNFIVALWLVMLLAVAGISFIFLHLLIIANAHTDNSFFLQQTAFDAIVVHTYCPRGAVTELPMRGRLIAQAAYLMAKRFRSPIIMAVGNTVPGEPRTESEIYRDFIIRFYDQEIAHKIILGNDKNARDTWRETTEAYRIAMTSGYRKILVIGMRPHLARIIPYWQKINQENLKIQFVGIYGPGQYYVWELAMIIAEFIIPPRTRRRNFVLNMVGRKD